MKTLSIAQKNILFDLAKHGTEGTSYVSHISSAKSLVSKGLVEMVREGFGGKNYKITEAGCEAIDLDYNDMIGAWLKRTAKSIMIHFVFDVCVTATEAELVEFAARYKFNNDVAYLVDAFIAVGGEIFVEIEPDTQPAEDISTATVIESAPEIDHSAAIASFDKPASATKRYEGEVIAITLGGSVFLRSPHFDFDIYIDSSEVLIPFLIRTDRVTFECNLVWETHPRAVNVKRLIDITPEATGPARSDDERRAMDAYDPEYDYLGMTPIDPRDTEIAQLKAEIATLKADKARLEDAVLPPSVIAAYKRASDVALYVYPDMDTYLAKWGMALESLYGSITPYIFQENK